MRYILSLLLLFIFIPAYAQQQATTLVVRAKAKDAKFIGTSIGGAYVLVKDPVTGKVLAEGLTEGSTGNTQRIMQESHQRWGQLADEGAAKFEATLQLEKPLFVTVEVWAPYNQPGARVQAQTQLWLLPGKHIKGDGLVLEIPGFIVNVLAPQTHESTAMGKAISLRANVVLTCGCPVIAGGIWDASQYEVEALVYKEGSLLRKVSMQQKVKDSTFEATYQPPATGAYEIIITAYDPKTGNTGADKVNMLVK